MNLQKYNMTIKDTKKSFEQIEKSITKRLESKKNFNNVDLHLLRFEVIETKEVIPFKNKWKEKGFQNIADIISYRAVIVKKMENIK